MFHHSSCLLTFKPTNMFLITVPLHSFIHQTLAVINTNFGIIVNSNPGSATQEMCDFGQDFCFNF